MMPSFSIQEVVRVTTETDAGAAIDNARDLAVHAEKLGFHRFWIGEHYNMPTVAGSAASIIIGHIAAVTKTIRVGAGGVMLPNHVPFQVAEQYGTLARMFPGRIDLALGRAPGTDQIGVRAMRRPSEAADRFPQDILELQAYFADAEPDQRLAAVPADGTRIPLWILGSSNFVAMLSATLGLPFVFGGHFAPQHMLRALEIYRERFEPSEQLASPYPAISVNIIGADTDEEAHRLSTSQKMSHVGLLRGSRELSQPPIDDMDGYWSPTEKAGVMQMLDLSIVGSVATIREGVAALVARTRAEELFIVSDIFDHSVRKRSLEVIAEAVGLANADRQQQMEGAS